MYLLAELAGRPPPHEDGQDRLEPTHFDKPDENKKKRWDDRAASLMLLAREKAVRYG